MAGRSGLDFPRLRMPANALISIADVNAPILPHVQEPDANERLALRGFIPFPTVFTPGAATKSRGDSKRYGAHRFPPANKR
jgi:hypothetical protein